MSTMSTTKTEPATSAEVSDDDATNNAEDEADVFEMKESFGYPDEKFKLKRQCVKSFLKLVYDNDNQKVRVFLKAHKKSTGFDLLLDPFTRRVTMNVTKSKENYLHIAAQNGNYPLLRFFLEMYHHPEFVNAKTKDDWTPLHFAASNGNDIMIRELLEHGADASAVTKDGKSAADMCLHKRNWPGVIALVKKGGFDLDAYDQEKKGKNEWQSIDYALDDKNEAAFNFLFLRVICHRNSAGLDKSQLRAITGKSFNEPTFDGDSKAGPDMKQWLHKCSAHGFSYGVKMLLNYEVTSRHSDNPYYCGINQKVDLNPKATKQVIGVAKPDEEPKPDSKSKKKRLSGIEKLEKIMSKRQDQSRSNSNASNDIKKGVSRKIQLEGADGEEEFVEEASVSSSSVQHTFVHTERFKQKRGPDGEKW